MNVVWDFENEGEFLQVMQLGNLLHVDFAWLHRTLHMPFLMYGRQDKFVNNYNTFALNTLNDLLKFTGYFHEITSVDIHNPKATKVANIDPSPRIKEVMEITRAGLICYPDKGATLRGYDISGASYVCLNKKRNQETGAIDGLEFAHFGGKQVVDNQVILIVDDLVDRGGTFIAAAKLLKDAGAASVSLYTTHGLYTHELGVQHLFNNGLDRVFNYKTEVLPDGHEKNTN